MSQVLMPVTAADGLQLVDGSIHPTGFWAEEFVVAHRDLIAAGHTVTVATAGGKSAPVDPGSVDPNNVGEELARELSSYLESHRDILANPAVLEDQDPDRFDAIVMPGGHGPMVDLASNSALGRILISANRANKVIAPFCHGPAALLSAINDDGSFEFAGRKLTAFTDDEERAGGVAGVPWFLASRLKERGAIVEDGQPWSDHVVVDGNLITGQNPQSSGSVAAAVVRALS